MKHRCYVLTILFALLPVFTGLAAGDDSFKPGTYGESNLVIVKGVPVLTLSGTPEEIGEAHGKLLKKQSARLIESYLKPGAMFSGGLERLKASSLKMDRHIPERFRKEMEAMARAGGQDYDMILTGAAFPDVYRGGGCSTLAVGGPAVQGGKPLLARNLDFFSMGVLNKYGIILICRPRDHHAFLSITWPGLIGVLSGMNEKGVCCAVMEVRSGIRKFDGMPSVLLFRRIMEEAATVEEGLKILKENTRVASNNLILQDGSGAAAVAEIGPGRFKVRVAKDGVVFATNHHRVGKRKSTCGRYRVLAGYCETYQGKLTVPVLKKALHSVNQGMISVQSMIFEPVDLRLHLAMGALPATKGPFNAFDFKAALTRERGAAGEPAKASRFEEK